MAPRVTKKRSIAPQKQGQKAKHDIKRRKEVNVSGFQKRMAQKPPKVSDQLDVYEYDDKQRKGRSRATVTLDLSKEEASEFAMEGEEDMDDLERLRQKLRMGEDLEIDSEDDEDIDSDDAFGPSDEERFAGHNLKAKVEARTKSSVRSEIDLNEDESEEEEDESEEEEDDVMDTHDQNENDDSEASDDAADLQSSNEEDEPQEALQALESYINGLEIKSPSFKRKASEMGEEVPGPPRQKRRILKEKTEVGVEGDFVPSTKQATKLQLADLISPLAANGASASVHALQSAAKSLQASKAAPLVAPLPLRAQDRIDRQAAYEQTKAEVQKWEPTMKRIREADHLSFPLQSQRVPESNVATLASDFKPATKLESAVDKLLKAAELREKDMAKTEELQMQHLTLEEIAERRAELRKARDLMFRAEIKAKRVAKIKSKAYRKIQKKERAKNAERLKEMDIGADEEAERMEAEIDRARERATLKHKNTGKWAMSMKHRGELDEDQRKEMQEMYDRGERLKRKIAGLGSDQDADDNDSQESDDDADVMAAALRELDELARDEPGAKAKSGLMEMQFMKRAERKENARSQGLVDSFKEELNRLGVTDEEGPATSHDQADSLVRVGGRVYYQSGGNVDKSASRATHEIASPQGVHRSSSEVTQQENPWLTIEPVAGKRSRAKNEVTLGKNSDAATLSKNAMKKRLRKQGQVLAQAKDDSNLEIDVNTIMSIPKTDTPNKSKRVPEPTTGHHRVDEAYHDDDVQEEHGLVGPRAKHGPTIFEQRELVARAFAGDNVTDEFAAEKRREMEADAPKEVDTTLPGWGSWGGSGITKPPPKPERIKRFPGVDPKKRQDYEKDHVIISEKKDKKAEKYLVKDLPFPYTSKAQFERRLEVPLGMEWNTRATFQKATLPRVVKKMGRVIEPLERLF